MRVHYLQHVSFEGLGFIKNWLTENKHEVTATYFFTDDYTLPSVNDIDVLIVLGGPMGVYDEAQYSWLASEKKFIKACIKANKIILGICLGAQLIADCLGATVVKAPHTEIGWYSVNPTNTCKDIAWFYNLFKKNPIVFHWHGDQFLLPTNSAGNLLVSQANINQAFFVNNKILGLQFHVEVTTKTMDLMLQNGAEELLNKPYIQSISQLLQGAKYIVNCNKIMQQILNNLFAS